MSTNVTWNGTTYSIPASGETGWAALSSFLLALGNGAAIAEEMKQAIRVATTSPVTVSDTTDCVIAVNRSVAGATTVNLPAGTDGRWFVIVDQKADAATNNITVTPNGAETINGSATYVMSQNAEAIIIAYSVTNTRWNVVGRFTSGAPLTNPLAVTGDMIYSVGTTPTKLATGATTGLLHGGNGAVPTWSLLVNADVSGVAAIAGSKIAAASSTLTGTVSYEGTTTYSNTGTTLTWAGNSAGPSSYTVVFVRTGKQVTVDIMFAGITMTNGQSLRLSGYSADYTPATPKWGLLPAVLNATNSIAAVDADSDGHIYIYKDANATVWTAVATNTGGVRLSFTYSLV